MAEVIETDVAIHAVAFAYLPRLAKYRFLVISTLRQYQPQQCRKKSTPTRLPKTSVAKRPH